MSRSAKGWPSSSPTSPDQPCAAAAATVPPFNEHIGISCDGCGQNPITGVRYHCTVCPLPAGFDLCAKCEARGRTFKEYHRIEHPLLKMRVPFVASTTAHGETTCPCMANQHLHAPESLPIRVSGWRHVPTHQAAGSAASGSIAMSSAPRKQTAGGGPLSQRLKRPHSESDEEFGEDSRSAGRGAATSSATVVPASTAWDTSGAAATKAAGPSVRFKVVTRNGYQPDGFHSYTPMDERVHGESYAVLREANQAAKKMFFHKNVWGLSEEEIQEMDPVYEESDGGCARWTCYGGEGEEWTVEVKLTLAQTSMAKKKPKQH